MDVRSAGNTASPGHVPFDGLSPGSTTGSDVAAFLPSTLTTGGTKSNRRKHGRHDYEYPADLLARLEHQKESVADVRAKERSSQRALGVRGQIKFPPLPAEREMAQFRSLHRKAGMTHEQQVMKRQNNTAAVRAHRARAEGDHGPPRKKASRGHSLHMRTAMPRSGERQSRVIGGCEAAGGV